VSVPGDLQVGGAIISNVRVKDTIMDLAVHNPGDAHTTGLVVESDAGTAFSGLVRGGGDTHEFVLFDRSPTRPLPHTAPPRANGALKVGALQASSSVTASNVAATNRADIDAALGQGRPSRSERGRDTHRRPAGGARTTCSSAAVRTLPAAWSGTPHPPVSRSRSTRLKGRSSQEAAQVHRSHCPLGGVAWSAPTATDTSFTPIPGVTAQTTMQGLCAEVASKVRHLVSTTEVSTTWKGNLIMDCVQMPLNTVHIAKAKGEPGQMCWGVDAGVAYVYVCTERDTWQRAALATWGA
jgi:hypothetical protein